MRTILAFPWKQEGHINELELNTVAVYLKRRSRTPSKLHSKFFLVLDSMVSRGCRPICWPLMGTSFP